MILSAGRLVRVFDSPLLRGGSVVSAGLLISSVTNLVGMRLLTELVAPAQFGGLALANGIITLLLGLLVLPLTQAAFRFWPDHEARGESSELIELLTHAIRRRLFAATALITLGAAVDMMLFGWLTTATWGLVLLGLVIDAARSRELTLLNASGRLGNFSVLTAADALARPIGSGALVILLEPSLEALLLGQVVASGICLVGFRLGHRKRGPGKRGQKLSPVADREAFVRFALPLSGIALVAWVTGMADRYIVGGMLGLAATGTYAAAYALASRPLLLVGQLTDTILRQRLYAAVSTADRLAWGRTMQLWLAANLGGGLVITGLLWLLAEPLVWLLLGAAYRAEAAEFLPWIALGHVFYLGAQAIERVLYAASYTKPVLGLQMATAAIGLAAAWTGAYCAGALGVAVAVPITFGAQMLMTAAAAQRV